AWNPHATLALVTTSNKASSSPSGHAPNPSPKSLLRSISAPTGVSVIAARPHPAGAGPEHVGEHRPAASHHRRPSAVTGKPRSGMFDVRRADHTGARVTPLPG